MIKVLRSVGLKVSEEGEKENFQNIFFSLDEKIGTEVNLDEKTIKYVKESIKRFKKTQSILENAWQGN